MSAIGGTGFLGRRVVRHLRNHGFSVRIASRHPNRGRELFGLDDPQVQSVEADIHDERSIASALAGVYGAVNAVSLYVERGRETFHSVHARRRTCSGIGSDAASPSLYIRKRGEGELAVRTAFVDAALMRPAVMFGPDDAFLTTILGLLGRLPVYPMFGRGRTKLQPAYVEDVAEAIARALQRTDMQAITFECGGPRVYTYEELVRTIANEAKLKCLLMPFPFVGWRALAWLAEMLPSPPVTRNQVELMQVDNVASPEMPGFGDLGIATHSVAQILQESLWDH